MHDNYAIKVLRSFDDGIWHQTNEETLKQYTYANPGELITLRIFEFEKQYCSLKKKATIKWVEGSRRCSIGIACETPPTTFGIAFIDPFHMALSFEFDLDDFIPLNQWKLSFQFVEKYSHSHKAWMHVVNHFNGVARISNILCPDSIEYDFLQRLSAISMIDNLSQVF
jgi:hypothetical protein